MDELRETTSTGREGVDALSIMQAARAYGMHARGVKVELDAIRYLDRGSILHWEFNHFVVFDRITKRGVEVVDPALGRRFVPVDEFGKSFTGVAITLQPGDEFERAGGRSKGVWRYLGPILSHPGLLARILTTSVLIQLFALALPLFTGLVIDRIVPRDSRHFLTVITVGLVAMVLFHFAASFVRAHLLLHLRTHLDLRISLGFIGHIVELPYQFFLQRSAGDLMMRLNSNTTVRELLTTTAASSLLDGILVTLYLILLFAASWSFATVVLALALLQIVVLLVSRRRNQRLMTEGLQAQAKSQSYLVQLFAGIETLKAVGAESRGVEHWSNLFVNEVNVSLARGRLNAFVESLMNALRIGSPIAILAFGTFQVLDGSLTLGTMFALSALSTGFLTPVGALITTFLQLQLLGSYMERINDVLDTPREQDKSAVRPAGRLRGRITVDDVWFRYSRQGPDVARGVSLEIEPGQKIAVVGRSGSGKSTLANLLLGLFRPTSGSVLYDGIDLATLETSSVRRQLGIVPQQAYLFGTSIRENIALADPSLDLDAIERAARQARIHDDIETMALGYETVLADGGASLSGGQRQRIALARALVHDPVILVLDEATSSLDAATEREIYDNLSTLDCTIIVIAHRLSTISRADQILVMDGGVFEETGTHEELMRLEGLYAELVHSQTGGAGAASHE
jgi:ABC-type bacteriocin/lantibiotic exporter with double-glycine peptidase domain